MPKDYLPSKEAELVAWLGNYNSLVGTNFAQYGVSQSDAETLSTVVLAYTNLYAVCASGATRTPGKIADKRTAKTECLDVVRRMVGQIQLYPGTTNGMREDLRINVRKSPTKRNRPAYMPGIEVTQVLNREVWFRLWDSADPDNKGKPKDVLGATVYSYVGAVPPENPLLWYSHGTTTRTRAQITVPGNDAATVWITAMWFNNAGSGPGRFPPAQANVAAVGGVPVGQQMKIAA